MLQNLEKLIGEQGVLRIHISNEYFNRDLISVKFRSFIYFINYPIKIFLIICVKKYNLPEYIITVVLIYELITKLFELFFYKAINEMIKGEKLISKRYRLLCCTNYNLLIATFERPIFDLLNSIMCGLLIFVTLFNERFVFAFIITLIWVFILKVKDVLKDLLIIYLNDWIQEDFKIIWNCGT
jgi:hypothetical protein